MFNLFSKKNQRLLADSSIRIVADSLVLFAVQLGNRITREILVGMEKSNENASYFILLETLCMYLHFSKNSSFSVFSKKEIPVFVTKLCMSTAEQFASVILDGEKETENTVIIATQLRDKYIETNTYYGSTTVLMDKDSPFLGNGLFQIYGRRMAEIICSNSNPEIIMRSIEILTEDFKGKELQELISHIN